MKIDSEKYGGACQCGREHQMATHMCVIEPAALEQFDPCLAKVGTFGKRCAVYDTNTYDIPNLRRPTADQEIIMDAEGLHANEKSTAELLRQITSGVDILVAVGSGTVHDIVRYSAKQLGVPFVAVPTAASCDGFCSNVAAMTWYGYKKTIPCLAPALVVADLNVIAAAPWRLTASGIGDMLGKYVALADWQIAHAVTGEAVCPVVYQIMREAVDSIWENCHKLRQGDLAAYEAVTYGLLMSGLAMQMIGTSRPASGAEHHISHFVEVEPAGLNAHSTALHGEKVGVGTVLISAEYHRLLKTVDIARDVLPYQRISEEQLLQVFGAWLFDACSKENQKDCLEQVTPQALIAAWPEICRIIEEMPSAHEIEQVLQKVDAKRTLSDIGVPEGELAFLLENSPLIRNRLTLMRMRRMLLH